MNPNKKILKLAKEILPRETYKKLKSLSDKKEQEETTKNAIRSELKHLELKVMKSVKEAEKYTLGISVLKNKSLLLPSKIKHFLVDFNKDEFYKLSQLLNEIKKEIKNVRGIV